MAVLYYCEIYSGNLKFISSGTLKNRIEMRRMEYGNF